MFELVALVGSLAVGAVCLLVMVVVVGAAAFFMLRGRGSSELPGVDVDALSAQAVSGMEHITSGAEHVRVVGTGPNTKVLKSSGVADLVDDDGDQVWVTPRLKTAVTPAQWTDDWGPLEPRDFDGFARHMVDIDDALGLDPHGVEALVTGLGYDDVGHWFRVRYTFLKHDGTGGPTLNDMAFGEAILKAGGQARLQQQGGKYEAAAAADPELLAPVDGVDLDTYALLAASSAQGMDQDAFAALLAEHGLDLARWERVNAAWIEKMQHDTSGTIAAAYGKAFGGAGVGAYGGAGASAAGTMGAVGGFTGGGAGGEEPIPFEKLCEIQGAMSAWSTSGQDVNAMMQEVFGISALDWSNMSMWWMTKMTTDMSLMTRYNDASEEWEKKYSAGGAGAGSDISF